MKSPGGGRKLRSLLIMFVNNVLILLVDGMSRVPRVSFDHWSPSTVHSMYQCKKLIIFFWQFIVSPHLRKTKQVDWTLAVTHKPSAPQLVGPIIETESLKYNNILWSWCRYFDARSSGFFTVWCCFGYHTYVLVFELKTIQCSVQLHAFMHTFMPLCCLIPVQNQDIKNNFLLDFFNPWKVTLKIMLTLSPV